MFTVYADDLINPEKLVTTTENGIDLVLIADRPNRANFLHDLMIDSKVSGVIRTITPGNHAIQRARQTGVFRNIALPDLFFFDYTDPDRNKTAVLREIAFGDDKAAVPVVLVTSPESQQLLDDGSIDGGKAVMLSPTPIASFIGKMHIGNRNAFFKALRILYEFGPLLVHAPNQILNQEIPEKALSA